ncbi:MAG: threonine synthase [Gemmataceae bacterium]|nr:threonine synthase [Gemmataceae bacterium]MCI0742837.1 threonine synthase [Gemmataceae bacterium]
MYVTHLESALDGARFEKNKVWTTHQGRPLWVRYDLDAVRSAVGPADFAGREKSLWRYRELLPLPWGRHSCLPADKNVCPTDVDPVTLGEGMTPLLHCRRLGAELGLSRLFIKDESQLPTGSFKSRGMAVAVSMAKFFGLKCLAAPTAGNAGGALAAYGARAGMEVFLFMPEDTPVINQMEAQLCGAKVFLVNGLINDCGKIVRDGIDKMGWFDMSTLKEPYRLEGKKTMGLELAEQLDWTLPDAIFYPTGGGTGLIGMWKAFGELTTLGWLKPPDVGRLSRAVPDGPGDPSNVKLPRLISCQSEGCAPIVRAFEKGERFAELFPNAKTIASGLRVPAAVGDFMMLDAIRASGGCAIAGREESIAHWMRRVAATEGIAICPETAVCFDCLQQLVDRGEIGKDEHVVVFNTGAAQKYPETMVLRLPRLDKDRPIDYQELART